MTEVIRVLGSSGREGKGEGQFAQPRGVCINKATKELFVVDCNNHRIQVFHLLSLSFIRQIGKGTQGSATGFLMYPVGICMDESNQLYVADTNNHRVVVFNHITGCYVRSIGAQGSALGCLNCPYGVYVDTIEGYLYVADYENNRIQVFDCETGNFVKIYGHGQGTGPGQFNQPIDVCLDLDLDYVIVADYSNNRVQVLSKTSGEYIRSIGVSTGPDALNGPRALCINRETNLLFISDRENHRIQMYNKTTHVLLRQIGLGLGVNPGQFNRPMELCVDNEEGVLIVVDGYNHRVQIMELPELQAEKGRLKALTQKKANPVLTKPIRPSLTAVNAHLNFSDARLVDLGNSYFTIEYPALGSPYTFTLSREEANLLRRTFPDFSQSLFLEGSEQVIEDIFVEKSLSKDNLLKQQADVFLNVLESLSVVESDDSILLMTAPSVVALHLLLVRGWSAHRFPLPVAKLILSLVINIEKGSTSYAETRKLLFASSELLKSALAKNSSLLTELIPILLDSLRVLMRDSVIEINEFLGIKEKIISRPESEEIGKLSEQKSKDTKSLLYLLEILSCCFQLRNTPPTNLGSRTDSFDLSSVITKLDGDNYDSSVLDMVFLVFGINPVHFLSKPISRGSNSADSITGLSTALQIPPSFLPMVESILKLLQLDQKTTAEKTSTDAEKFISLRCSFFDSSTTFFRDVHQFNRLKEPKTEKRTRGGRNVWDGMSQIRAGDLIDCMDKEKSWFESVALEVQADGSVRVHFMGWGSKWDDVVLITEISTRIAVLNTYTKDWRSELFEGGLIEIKCNDDLVNQKWMWGKITKLNREESWLEVAYSFSNEPVVVKKAWLWGETICPVGMHTKDKSRAAASLIARPEKTIAEMLKSKMNDEIPESEICLFDSEDDYYEIPHPRFDRGLSTGLIGGSVLSLSMLNLTSNAPGKNKANQRGLAFLLSEMLVVRLTKEILLAISDLTSSEEVKAPKSILDQQSHSVIALIRCLTTLPCTSFVYHQIIKPVYFQAGGRAKLLAFLPQQSRENNFQDSKSNSTIHRFTTLSESLLQLQKRYIGLVSNLFSSALSSPSNQYIIEKLQSTILYCGFTPLANDLINSFLENEALLLNSFQPLLSSRRFHAKLIPTRKLFRSVISAASSDLVEKFIQMIERIIIRKRVQNFTTLESLRSFFLSRESLARVMPKDVTSEAFRFIDEFTEFYAQTKFVISKEILQSSRLQCSVERILSDEFDEFDSTRSKLLSFFLTEGLFTLLLRSLIGKNTIRSDNVIVDYDYASIASYMEKSLQLISLTSNEELLYRVFQNFEGAVWQNLLLLNDGTNLFAHNRITNLKSGSNSLTVLPSDLFELIGQTLPYGKRISSKLFYVNTSTNLTREFLLYEMDKIDVEILNQSGEDSFRSEFHYFLSNGGEFSLSCLDYLHAPSILKVDYFKNLVLPPLFSAGQSAFEAFYHRRTSQTLPFGIPKRLLWLKGFGKMQVECIIHSRKYLEMTISEAQFAVLREVSEKTSSHGSISVLELSVILNLSVQVIKILLQSLMDGPLKLISKKAAEAEFRTKHHLLDEDVQVNFCINEKDLITSSMQLMSIYSQNLHFDFYEKFLSLMEKHRNTLYQGIISENIWKENCIDACILRTLKSSSFDSTDPLVSLTVLVTKCRSKLQSTSHLIEEKEIVDRIFILVEKGFIYQSPFNLQELMLSYFPIESDAFGSIRPVAVPTTAISSPSNLKRPFVSLPSRDDLLPQTVTFHSFTKSFFLDIHSSEELSLLFLQTVLSHPKLGAEVVGKKNQASSTQFFFDLTVNSLGVIIQQMNLLLVRSIASDRNSINVAPCVDLFLALLRQIISRPPENLLSKVSWFHYCALSPLTKYNIYSLFVQSTQGHLFLYDRDLFFGNSNFVAETISAIWDVPFRLNELEANSSDFPSSTRTTVQNAFLRYVNHYLVLQASLLIQSHYETEDFDNNEEKQSRTRDYSAKNNCSLSLSIFYKLLMDYLSSDADLQRGATMTDLSDQKSTVLFTAREDQSYHSTIAHSPYRSQQLGQTPSEGLLSSLTASALYSNPTAPPPYLSLNFPSALTPSTYKAHLNQSKQSQKDFMNVLKDRVKDYKSKTNEVNLKKVNYPDDDSSNPSTSPYSNGRRNPLLTAAVVQELLSADENEVLARGQSNLGPYSGFRSFSEHKSSSSFLSSPPASPFPFPGLNALNSDNTLFSEEVAHGVNDFSALPSNMFLLPTFQLFEVRLNEFFRNPTSLESGSGASIVNNERVWTFLIDSLNHLAASLVLISPLASQVWWVNAESENLTLKTILQAGFDLHKRLRDSKNEQESATSEIPVKTFKQFLDLRELQANKNTQFDRIILTLVELTGCSWTFCSENLQKSTYDILDMLDSCFNQPIASAHSNFLRGSETVAASDSFKWKCFSCMKTKRPNEMFALKACAHFACKECWQERLLPKLTDLFERTDTLEDHPILLLREFRCIRQELDSECTCGGNISIDLLRAVFEDNLSPIIPVLQRVYKYYANDYEQYQQKENNAVQQQDDLPSYLNLCTYSNKIFVDEGEQQQIDERASSRLCCSVCITNCFCKSDFRTSDRGRHISFPISEQNNDYDSMKVSERQSCSIDQDHCDRIALKFHVKNQSKISYLQGKIHSCEYSLQYCEDDHSFAVFQKQLQFWKLLLNCIYFYDHLFTNFSEKSTTSPIIEDSFLFDSNGSRLSYQREYNESLHQFHSLQYQDIFNQLEERMLQYMQNQELGSKTNSASDPYRGFSTNSSSSMSAQIHTGIVSLPSNYSFATLSQLVESIRSVHLILYDKFVRTMKLSSKKQLYHLSKTSVSIIHLKEEALRESNGKVSGIGYEDSYLNSMSSNSSIYGTAPFLPKFPTHVAELFREIEFMPSTLEVSRMPKNLTKFDHKAFLSEMEENPTANFLAELSQVLQGLLSSSKFDASSQDRYEQSHQKRSFFLQKWKSSIKELSSRKLTGFSTTTDLNSSDMLSHCFSLLHQGFLTLNSSLQKVTAVKDYILRAFTDHMELFTCLVNYTTYYCKFNIHSALDIYLIDVSEPEVPNKSDQIFEGNLNLFNMIDIVIQGLENIIRSNEASSSNELSPIMMNTLDIFQILVHESTFLVDIIENKVDEFSDNLDNHNEAKVDAVLPITVSPSFTTSLVGSAIPGSIYRHLLLFYQRLIRIYIESSVTSKTKGFTLEEGLEELQFDRLQRVYLNAMSLFYSNYRCLSSMSFGKDISKASISSTNMEINQKKDLLLMDIFEFLWKEILSWANLRSQARSRQLETEQRQIFLSNAQDRNFNESAESSEDEVEAKTEPASNCTVQRVSQNALKAEKILSLYSSLFIRLLHKVIVVIKRRGIDQRYSTLNQISAFTSESSSNANQKMKEEDKRSLEKDISNSSSSGIDSNYFLMVSVVQRLLSNYHDILLMVLDSLFSPQALRNHGLSEDFTPKEEVVLSDMLSEIIFELFTNHYFVFLLRTIMNPVSMTSSVQGLLQFSDPSSVSPNTSSYHDRILSLMIRFFDEVGTIPLLDDKVRWLSSTSSSLEREEEAVKEEHGVSSHQQRFPASSERDHMEKVLIQYLPPSPSNLMSNSPIIYEYSLAEVLHYLKRMLWALNIVYSFWDFYFEYLLPTSSANQTETQPSPETKKPPAPVLQFHELLQHRQQLLSMISIHEYHEFSSVFYTKSYYQNSFIITQKLFELFFEKLIKPLLPPSDRSHFTNSPSFSQRIEEKKEGKIGKKSFSLVYPLEEEESDSQLFRDEGSNSDENIFNMKLSSLAEPAEEFYTYRRSGQRYRMERELQRLNREEASTISSEEVDDDEEERAAEDEEDDERHNLNNADVFFNRWLRRNPSSLDLIRFFYLNQPNHLPTAFILESDDENEENDDDDEDDEDDGEEQEEDEEDENQDEDDEEDEEENDEDRFHVGRNIHPERNEHDEEEERFH